MSSIDQPSAVLSGRERDLATKLSDNPMDLFQGKTLGWLEDFIRITVGNQRGALGSYAYTTGDPRLITKDLTAQTGVYVYEDAFGQFLYMNGAAASQTTYAALYAYWGANAWGADSGGNFLLPDCRGRALFMCGTNAAADLGDNDGVAEASRQAKHAPTSSLSVDGAPSAGSLAIGGAPALGSLAATGTFGSSTHTHGPGSYAVTLASLVTAPGPAGGVPGSGTVGVAGTSDGPSATVSPSLTGAPSAGTLAVTGAPGLGTLGVSGTIGTGMAGDAPAHLFIGSLLVRF